ncbi:MAG: thiY [Rhodospirillales bacterium]|nr:thiY [Rhodospirillales bacterium]
MRVQWLSAALLLLGGMSTAQAAQEISFLTSWKAEAEHGGYYMALAKGYYASCGVDLRIRQGGPMIDGKQLLVTGAVDIMMSSYGDTAFQVNEAGFPARAIMAAFQKNPQILMTHAGNGIETIEDMRGKPVMIGASSRTTFWAFLRAKFGLADNQIRSYTGQLGPYLVDQGAIQQGLITNEPFLVLHETGVAPKTFLLADLGYVSYSSIAIASQKLIDTAPDAIQCFVNASIRGWIEFLADPLPAVALIKADNPDNTDELIAYAVKTLKSAGIVETEETTRLGIGAMTDERWKSHFALLADQSLIPKNQDYSRAFTLQFVNKRFPPAPR